MGCCERLESTGSIGFSVGLSELDVLLTERRGINPVDLKFVFVTVKRLFPTVANESTLAKRASNKMD
jgi:hypothetical protein